MELAGGTGASRGLDRGKLSVSGAGTCGENWRKVGRGKLKGLMEVHGRIVRGTCTGFEGSAGEFSHVGDILTCFNRFVKKFLPKKFNPRGRQFSVKAVYSMIYVFFSPYFCKLSGQD